MSVVANVAINIDAKNAAAVLDEIKRKVEAMNGAFGKIPDAGEKAKSLTGELVALGTKLLSAATAAEVLRKSISASFERSQAEARLKALTSAYGETAEATKLAAAASDKFGLTQTDATKAIADVYGRLRPLGFSLKEISGVYDGFNVLTKQAGINSQEASGIFTQLSQALGSGTLRGDEFNRMAESMPSILGLVSRELGVSQNALRKMAADGKITGDVVVSALQKAAAGAKDLDKFLDPSTKAMNQLAKSTEDAQVKLGNLIKPVVIKTMQGLASALDFVSKNIKQIVQTATFLGTFAGVVWTVAKATAAWAAAQRALSIAAAFTAAMINPASLATIGIALGAATLAAYGLGKAMDGAANDTAKIDPEAQKAAKAVTAAEEASRKFKEELEKAKAKATELAIELQTKVVTAAKAATAAMEEQVTRKSQIGSIVGAQIDGEIKLNDLYKIGLEQQLQMAKFASQKRDIVVQIAQIEIRQAQLVYQQALANLQIENEKLKLQQRLAVLKGYEILAEGKLQILKAKSPEEAKAKTQQLNEALTAQNQVIRATATEVAAQQVLNNYMAKTAELQYKASVATTANALQQRLMGQDMGLSANQAREMAQSLANGATSATAMGGIQDELAGRMTSAAEELDAGTQAAIQNAEQFKVVADAGISSTDAWRQSVLNGVGAQQQVAVAVQQTTDQIVAANNIRSTSAIESNKAIEASAVSSAATTKTSWLQGFQNFGTELGALIGGAFTNLGQLLEPVKNQWITTFTTIGNAWRTTFETMGGIVRWFAQAGYAIFDTLYVTPVKTLWNKLVESLRPAITAQLTKIGAAWKEIKDEFVKNVVTPITKEWEKLTGLLSTTATKAVGAVQQAWQPIANWFRTNVTDPLTTAWNNLTQLLPNAMKKAIEFVKNTWNGAINSIKQSVRGLLQYIANIINSVGDRVNVLIDAFNRLPGNVDIPRVGRVSVPAFAEGGIVTKPTLAMVGEGGEPEYIIPESKMAATAANYLSGSGAGDAFSRSRQLVSDIFDRSNRIASGENPYARINLSPQINIKTGPVVQQNNRQYVTVEDLESALRQTSSEILASLRTPSGRYATGVR